MTTYSISRNGKELGNFDVSQVAEGMRTGSLKPTDWAWAEGMTDWKPLAQLFPSVAPVKPARKASTAANPTPAVTAQRRAPVASAPTAVAPQEKITHNVILELAGTKLWVRIVSIPMWIASVGAFLGALGTLAVSVAGASALSKSGAAGGGLALVLLVAVAYAVGGMLILYPTLKLTAYASKIHRLEQTRSQTDLIAALCEQRRFWKFYGILIGIYMGVVIVGGILALALGVGGLSFLNSLPTPK